jgi:DNA-binding NarL/FixJ family response regulator
VLSVKLMGVELQTVIRVVLADDEELVRHGLQSVLESDPGIAVVGTAADGAELVRTVTSTPCDVVLVDVRMPGTDGLTAVRRLVGSGVTAAIAVLTTFDLDDYVNDALDAGAMGFLLKDASPEFLRRAVHDLAAGGAVIDPRIVARLLPRLRESAGGPPGVLGVRGGVQTASPGDVPGRSAAQSAAAAAAERALAVLSQRERQVLDLIGDGASNGEIALRLEIAESTVKGYVSAVLAKLGAANRVQAALIAKRLKLASE